MLMILMMNVCLMILIILMTLMMDVRPIVLMTKRLSDDTDNTDDDRLSDTADGTDNTDDERVCEKATVKLDDPFPLDAQLITIYVGFHRCRLLPPGLRTLLRASPTDSTGVILP